MHPMSAGDGTVEASDPAGPVAREPDASGAFADVYRDGDRVTKVVTNSSLDRVVDNLAACLEADIAVAPTFATEQLLPGYGDGALVVRQPAVAVDERPDPEAYLDRVAPLARRAADAGFAIDVKPSSYGEHRGELVYHDVQDLGSVRRVPEPERAMAAQAAHHLDGGRYGTDDIMARWFE